MKLPDSILKQAGIPLYPTPAQMVSYEIIVRHCAKVCRSARYSATVLDGMKKIAYSDECHTLILREFGLEE